MKLGRRANLCKSTGMNLIHKASSLTSYCIHLVFNCSTPFNSWHFLQFTLFKKPLEILLECFLAACISRHKFQLNEILQSLSWQSVTFQSSKNDMLLFIFWHDIGRECNFFLKRFKVTRMMILIINLNASLRFEW